MAHSVKDAVEDGQDAIDLKELKEALKEKDRGTLQRIVDNVIKEFKEALSTSLPIDLLNTLADGGVAAAATSKAEGTYRTADVTLAFDRVNPQSLKWANESAAALVTNVSGETKRGIQEIIARSFEEGIPPAASARLIRESIGLTERGAKALGNAEARLRKAKPGTLVKLGRKKYRIPAGGLSTSRIENFTSKYGTKLLNDRAKMIARTETIAAANEGQRQLWLQAEQQGLLTGTELREWIITPDDRLCEMCEEMEGQLRGIKDPFVQPGTGGEFMGPPLHPDCRCAVGLTDKKMSDEKAAAPKMPPTQKKGPIPISTSPAKNHLGLTVNDTFIINPTDDILHVKNLKVDPRYGTIVQEQYDDAVRSVEAYLRDPKVLAEVRGKDNFIVSVMDDGRYILRSPADLKVPVPGGIFQDFFDADIGKILGITKKEYSALSYSARAEANAQVQLELYARAQYAHDRVKFWNRAKFDAWFWDEGGKALSLGKKNEFWNGIVFGDKVLVPIAAAPNLPSEAFGKVRPEGYTGLPQSVVDNLAVGESNLLENSFETGMSYNVKTGRLVTTAIGDEQGVFFTQAQMSTLKNTITTHNHPLESQGWFSLGDVKLASKTNVAEMRMIDPQGEVHRLLRPKGGWPDVDDIEKVFKKMEQANLEWKPLPESIMTAFKTDPSVTLPSRYGLGTIRAGRIATANAFEHLGIEYIFVPAL